MFKIKKYVYKLLTVVLALMVVLNTSAIGVLAGSNGSVEATPEPRDYAFSNGTITGLKTTYLDGLTDEQKQNIRLEIPGEINGEKVTAIGDSAFSKWYNKKYDGYDFASLDLSKATSLESIGKDTFYSCKKLTGDLCIPDTVTQIGENAFRECKAFDGTLHLPKNVKVISKYAFYNCSFTGSLELPSNLKNIGDSAFRQSSAKVSFTGELILPESVITIEVAAFSGQQGFSGVDLSKCVNVTSIPSGVFRYCNFEKLIIPENIQTIGPSAFAENSALKTVYLPERKNPENADFVAESAFDSTASDCDIICKNEDYDYIHGKLKSIAQGKLTFPVTISFSDDKSNTYDDIERLYKRTYNYIKQSDGSWKTDTAYTFPPVKGETKKVWSVEKDVNKAVREGDTISEKKPTQTLYAVNGIIDPVIEYSEGIDKVYDGKPAKLTVTAMHPDIKTSGPYYMGDKVYYYTWKLLQIGKTETILQGMNVNVCELTDVYAPGQAIGCEVTVQACTLVPSSSSKVTAQAVPFYTEKHTFTIKISQAEPMVNPNIASGVYQMTSGNTALPEIKLSDGDTPGAIAWKSGQKLHEGAGSYEWTFTPEKNSQGQYNYKPMEGTVELYCTTKNFDDDFVNGKIEALPSIEENQEATEAQKKDILDAYAAYQIASDEIKAAVNEEAQQKMLDAVAKIPQFETATEGLAVKNEQDLLTNLTAKDAAVVKDSDDTKCTLKVVSSEVQNPEDTVQNAIAEAAGSEAKVGGHFDVQVVKTIESGSSPATEILTTVKKPLKLVFNVPKALQSANRKFFIIRAHEDAEGKVTAEKLLDEDNDPSTITVTSDKFSTYAIAYAEEESSGGSSPGDSSYVYNISAFAGDHGVITPSGTAYAYYGSTKTFSFTPDEGYKVTDVVVDGASIGAVSSYTFENITKAHTIAVTFELIADDQDRIINGVKATTIKASSSARKGSITVKWKKSTGFKVDYFQVFRSTKKNSGYGNKAFYTTKTGTQKSYKNTKKLRKGTRYYYKVRGVRTIDGVKVCTKWSNKAIRIAK
ncbi:leucine-rich repeat protein [Emergencia sp.]|uniref:leucine-rich repeat protein n=1 Tax=Emergencia sp. TaxID=1926557 RepID=UPI003AF1BCBC